MSKSLLHILIPRRCVACSATLLPSESQICLKCEEILPLFPSHTNPLHWSDLIFEGRIKTQGLFFHLQFTRGSITQKIMHEIKYGNNLALARDMGKQFGRLRLADSCYDAIIPLPIHEEKMKKRGYNQSERICEGVSEVINTPIYTNSLIRTAELSSQTDKSRLERIENTKDAFEVIPNEIPQNAHILLIDDTLTTGATLESAVICLNQSGYSNISLGCLAFAQK